MRLLYRKDDGFELMTSVIKNELRFFHSKDWCSNQYLTTIKGRFLSAGW